MCVLAEKFLAFVENWGKFAFTNRKFATAAKTIVPYIRS